MHGMADIIADPAITGTRVEVQVLTTLKCNLRCTYCSLGVGEVLGSQSKPQYSIDQLAAFVERHLRGKEIYFTLYGGEPTLNTRFALQLMERFPRSRFNLQTNGTLLHRVPAGILRRLSNINVSIDGGEAVTDAYRGKGVYAKVLQNVAAVRPDVHGTLTARVTWWSGDTTFEEVDALARAFDFVYFQFAQEPAANSAEFVRKKKQVVSELVDRFFAADGLYPIVPIMGAVRNKIAPWRLQELTAGMTQCRVSTNLLNVMPNGKIYPCPDMMYAAELQQGDVVENWLRRSPLQPQAGMPCPQCSAYDYCRGNCMKNMYLAYVRNDTQWRHGVTEPICELIRHLGDEVDRHDPAEWFAKAALGVRNKLMHAEVYEFCEVMP